MVTIELKGEHKTKNMLYILSSRKCDKNITKVDT